MFRHLIFGCLLLQVIHTHAVWLAPEERAQNTHNITVVGTGYVGLTLGTCLAECGHQVICVDIDAEKIARLQQGIIPIYEPGLSDLVQSNAQEGRLSFTTSLEHAAEKSDTIFIAVGTPTNENGQADLTALLKVVEALKPFHNRLICIKSTVPVGTCKSVQSQLESDAHCSVEIVSNPEYFREGCAVKDFFEGDRIIVGCDTCRGINTMQELYAPLTDKGMPLLITSLESSEMIKYASNAFLAVKIAYINELSQLCEKVDADVLEVAIGMGLDRRIGKEFLKAGPGYGGSCFPKDTVALLDVAKSNQVELQIVDAAVQANEEHKRKIYDRTIQKLSSTHAGQVVAILGLAFKANTDDIRYSPALGLISALQSKGIGVRAYDPAAMSNTKAQFPDAVYCEDPYEAAEGADCLVLLQDWEEFLQLDLARLKSAMRSPIVFDTRNILDKNEYQAHGFSYEGIGRPSSL